jgi:hypothetical protein
LNRRISTIIPLFFCYERINRILFGLKLQK